MYIQKRKIYANEDVEVAPEATDLLFEAEDVAELVAEVTEEEVTVDTTEDGGVEFEVGEETFTVIPEGDEEILEASRKTFAKKRPVKASSKKRTIKSSTARKVSPRR